MNKFILKEKIATRFGFGEGLVKLGEKYPDIVALGADITKSVSLNFFAEKFPDRYFSFGIAEQNIIGVATGMALSGKIPFVATYGTFVVHRTADQIRICVCYNNVPVKIGGAHVGISVGPDGATHQSLEDIAVMRALPNMTILSPCDYTQTKLATIASVEQVKGPCYIRFGREPMPDFTHENTEFIMGKGQIMNEGNDVTIIATGHLVWEALQSAYELEKQGIYAKVINIHTIKPIDEEIIIQAANETKAIVTAEEHQIIGGLGSAVAEVVAKNEPVPVEFIGMPDRFGESGTPYELMEKYGMTYRSIMTAVNNVLKRKN